MKTTIRPIQADDREDWARLFRAHCRSNRSALTDDHEARVWDWLMDSAAPFHGRLAHVDHGAAVGLVHFQDVYRPQAGALSCYLSDLFVEPAFRGSGAGRRLVEAVIETARDRRLANVRWLTHEHNYDARRLYDRFVGKSDYVLYTLPL